MSPVWCLDALAKKCGVGRETVVLPNSAARDEPTQSRSIRVPKEFLTTWRDEACLQGPDNAKEICRAEPANSSNRFTINLITPDNGEKFLVELENATLTNIKGFLAEKPDLTLTINRFDLEQTMSSTMIRSRRSRRS